jgi:hypothetical protein
MPLNFSAIALKTFSAFDAFALDHCPDLWPRMMLSGVIFNTKDIKIFKSIVVLNSITMVDMFSGVELAAQMLLHNDTVLKLEISANSNCDVPI